MQKPGGKKYREDRERKVQSSEVTKLGLFRVIILGHLGVNQDMVVVSIADVCL